MHILVLLAFPLMFFLPSNRRSFICHLLKLCLVFYFYRSINVRQSLLIHLDDDESIFKPGAMKASNPPIENTPWDSS